jgi:outer membrane receptor protein involved in Fe transport
MSNKKVSQGQRKALLRGASFVAAAAAAFSGGQALAQQAGSDEEIIVTGTRIPQPNLQSAAPVTQLTAADIQAQGATRLEDMTNQLPQVFATQGANVSNGASGTAEISLRGLGSGRTLVLLNGRRLPYGSDSTSAADLNQIPGPMVQRVEVLTGGASSIYGSDAVAGVVNFIMRSDFEGLRVDGQYGFYQHHNDSNQGGIRDVVAARGVTNPAQFQVPADNQDDGYGKELSAIFGASTADHRGNVTAYATYRTNDAVLQRDRDYSACSLGAGLSGGDFTCGGSSTSYPGRFYNGFTFASRTIDTTTGNTFRPFNANTDQYNFGPLNYYQRPDERYALGAFAHYDINPHITAYAETMFSEYKSTAQIAPSGDFLNTSTLNCGNPLFGPGMATFFGCSAADVANDTIVPAYVARRNVEGGGRQDTFDNTSFRMVGGLRGPLNDSWNYDVALSFSRNESTRVYRNEMSVTRLRRALDVVDVGSGPQCRSVVDGTDLNCVPWNIWSIGGVTQAALDYLQVPLVRTGFVQQQDLTASVQGDLAGVQSPWAETPVAVAFGIEYRRDYLERTVDASYSSGDGAGQGGPTFGFAGAASDVFEVFGEARIQIAEHQAFADDLSLDLAYRHSHYNTGINDDTYNAGMQWAPIADFKLRGSYAHAVRAPNVIELFAAQGPGLFDMADDPCDATDPASDGFDPGGNCVGGAAYQVTAGQSTSGVLTSPAGQYNGLFGGNPSLGPETANTQTVGFLFQPSFLEGFNISVDYWRIAVENQIGIVGAASTVAACYSATPDPTACALITRNPANGTLWIGSGQVSDLNVNLGGTIHTSGYDINASYSVGMGSLGDMRLALVATKLDNYFDGCEGLYGAGFCGTPNPEWRGRFRATWETPWNLELIGTVRYFGAVDYAGGASGAPDDTLDSQTYLDLAGNWQVRDNVKFRMGANNIMDLSPPINRFTGAGFGNGNTYPQVYDALGRWVFVGLSVDF